MYVEDFLRVLRTKWYVIVPGLVLTFLATAFAYRSVPLSYQAQSDVVFLPVSVSHGKPVTPNPGSNNPYLGIGDVLRPAMDVVTRVVNDDANQASFTQQFPDASYVLADAPNTTAPIVTAVVTSKDANEAAQALSTVVSRVEQTMAGLQKTARTMTTTPPSMVVVTHVLSRTPPTAMTGSRTRAAIAVAILGVALSLVASFIADGVAMRRRRRGASVTLEDWTDLNGDAPKPTRALPATRRYSRAVVGRHR